jgi:hypothetical protein
MSTAVNGAGRRAYDGIEADQLIHEQGEQEL